MEKPTVKNRLVHEVLHTLRSRVSSENQTQAGIALGLESFAGKMLRTRLAQSLAADNYSTDLVAACAAVEFIHTASLFHDDVIDGASLRRGRPTLWREFTPSSAVLVGDLMFCEALEVLLDTGNQRLQRLFTGKVKEVCEAEMRQELLLRGEPCDVDTCLEIARGKTGPLFAFTAMACAGDDRVLELALEETGYRIGCAYQIADDLLDECGSEADAGKTLGTDRTRRKFTLAQQDIAGTRSALTRLCQTAADPLKPWPALVERAEQFITKHLVPAMPESVWLQEAVAVGV